MSREELIEKMCEADAEARGWDKFVSFSENSKLEYRKGMAAALDVAVGELRSIVMTLCDERHLNDHDICYLVRGIDSRYLKPKSDPAVEAVLGLQLGKQIPWKIENRDTAELIVAAVDKARGRE